MPRRLARLLLGSVLLASSAPARGEDATAMVVGPAGTVETANQALAKFQRERVALADVLRLAPGFPRVLGRKELPSLAEGEHQAVLGICPNMEAVTLGLLLETFDTRELWFRPAPKPDGSFTCPQIASGWKRRGGFHIARADSTFSSLLLIDAAARSGPGLRLVLFLRDRDGALVDWKEQTFPAGCEPKLTREGEAMRLDMACPAPGGAKAERLHFEATSQRIRPVIATSNVRSP